MIDDLLKIAEALRLPGRWLLAVALVGFAFLAAALASGAWTWGACSAAFGLVITGVGVRAMLAPSRPFDVTTLSQPSGLDFVNTTRRLGAFYVFAGLIWVGPAARRHDVELRKGIATPMSTASANRPRCPNQRLRIDHTPTTSLATPTTKTVW